MESGRTAILLGATGLVGGHCLELLLESEAYSRVVSLGRRGSGREGSKLEEHVVDFEHLYDSAHLFRGDDLFCCLGTTIKKAGSQAAFRQVDFNYPVESARLASENGTAQFLLVSALGADSGSRIFYNRTKGEVEEAVARLPFHGVQIFRPSLLLGERREFRAGERVAEKGMKLFSFLLAGPLKKYRPVHARDVAAAMIRVATENPAGVNRFESDRIAEIAKGLA
ncbi:MAG TPA: oxidoreductase [Pyrinomonadaceae bacterium]|nr:oxidoreductase [Pyrinomonadaceae bacterium]